MKNKYSKFFSLLKQANAQGLNMSKEEVVKDFTNGKTESLSSLSAQELNQLENKLMQMTPQNTPSDYQKSDPVRDAMRKAIISAFKSINRSTDDAIAWAEKHGPVQGECIPKKKFNDLTTEELILLIRNAEKVVSDYQTSFKKHSKQFK